MVAIKKKVILLQVLMQQLSRRILFGLMVILLSLNGRTIHGYWHLVEGHGDTVHDHHDDILRFEEGHHHCSFSDYVTGPFIFNLPYSAQKQRISERALYTEYYTAGISRNIDILPGRGPPSSYCPG